MSILSDAEGFQSGPGHPSWCDRRYCDLLKPDNKRRVGDHRSAPRVVERPAPYAEQVTVQLHCFAYEDPQSAETFATVRIDEQSPTGEVEQLHTYSLALGQVEVLAAQLADLVREAVES